MLLEDDPALDELRETIDLLAALPGGGDLLNWFGGKPNFGDAEIVSLHLDRDGTSTLEIETVGRRPATIVFHFDQWIDVSLLGFSQQNVVAGLLLRPAKRRDIVPTELGVGFVPADIELELEPCFGARGMIQGRIKRIDHRPAAKA